MSPVANDVQADPDKGILVGAMIGCLFGVVWTEWAASGVSGAGAGAIRVAGFVVAIVIFLSITRLMWLARRQNGSGSTAPGGKRPGSMFFSPAYWVVVALEVLAVRGGTVLLEANGHDDYVIAWVAIAVGVHFLALARLFFAEIYWVGMALIVAGVAGALVGVAGGGSGGIRVTSGLLVAGSLFFSSAWLVVRAPAGIRGRTIGEVLDLLGEGKGGAVVNLLGEGKGGEALDLVVEGKGGEARELLSESKARPRSRPRR